jgi:hypothetical protein
MGKGKGKGKSYEPEPYWGPPPSKADTRALPMFLGAKMSTEFFGA